MTGVNWREGTPGLAHSSVAIIKAPPSDVQYPLLSPSQTVRFLLDLKLGNEASKVIYQGINQILTGTPASQVLPQVQSRLQALLK